MWHVRERRGIMQDFGVGHRSGQHDRRRCRWEDDAEIDRIHLVQDGVAWRAGVNTETDPLVSKKCREFLG
jgi:hypothetical protein